MLSRLMRWFSSQHRHVTFLVGVLVAMFVLTVVMAVQVHRADVARERQAYAALRDLAASAVGDWATFLQQRAGDALLYSFRGGLRELDRDPAVPLQVIADATEPAYFCPSCSRITAQRIFFALDPVSGGVEATATLAEPLLHAIAARAAAGEHVQLRETIGGAVYAIEHAGGVTGAAVLVRLDQSGAPLRIVGYTVSAEELRDNFVQMFHGLRLLPAAPVSLAADSLYAARVLVGRTPVLDEAPAGLALAVTETLRAPPLSGVTLTVGVREDAVDRLLVGGSAASGLPLLIGLLIAISALIAMALLLVRREAELVRLRADFVSSVSHELRTPLAQIRMFTETLLLGRVRSDLERRRSLEIIDQEARRLTHLVENVLLFSKSEGGRAPSLVPEPTQVAAEVRNAVESFGPLCRSRNVEIRMELQEGLTAPIDRCALRQVLVNLIENALKYGPAGQRITLGAALFDGTARVWVDDEGPGIPPEEREKVFDSFYRIARDGDGRRSGSGIGLAVVRELVRLHGGTAVAEGAPGGGARLVAEFPGAHLQAAPPASGLAAAS
jgi:signal transduction histidine kinase